MLSANRHNRTVFLSLLACMAFIALAVWSWGVPIADVMHFFWLSLVLLLVVIGGAALLIFVLKFARSMLHRNNRDPNDKP